MTLDQLQAGMRATVSDVDATSPVMLRLMEMGLVPGASVKITTRAPFGGPLRLEIEGCSLLSIRRAEARNLVVVPD